MNIVLGVDIGASTVKIAGARSGARLAEMVRVKVTDPVESMHGAVDTFLHKCGLAPSDVSAVCLTGAGSTFVDEKVCGAGTYKVSEFTATGTGALRLSGLEEALVISMGTGTAFVMAGPDNGLTAGADSGTGRFTHIGGTGIGGGTILGLASLLTSRRDIDGILTLAGGGDLRNIDLLVGDIMKTETKTLAADLTASNFGKIKHPAAEQDIALGVVNMVYEVVGMMALFALRTDDIDNIVLAGGTAVLPRAREVFDTFGKVSGKNFLIPENAVFATAIGALEAGVKQLQG